MPYSYWLALALLIFSLHPHQPCVLDKFNKTEEKHTKTGRENMLSNILKEYAIDKVKPGTNRRTDTLIHG
jgi:hypothetical protein